MNEEEKTYHRSYHRKHIDKIRAFRKQYYQKHKEEIKEKVKKWKEENKEYIKTRDKKYHEKNREKINKHQNEHHKEIMQKFLTNYKIGKCCAICGYKEYPEILQFHHKNEKKKSFNISTKLNSPLLKEEVDKCILLCPNCHSWLHFNEHKKKI